MRARVTALALAAALLGAAGGAVAAEAPSRDRVAPPGAGASPRRWRVPLGAGVSYAVPTGNISSGVAFADAFGGGPTLRLDAGLAWAALGASFVWRRGFVSPGKEWCPTGARCTARFDAVGGALTVSPGWDEGFSPVLMVGAAVDEGEVRWSGGFHRVTGRELFASLFMGPHLGDASSPWRVGGYLDLRVLRLDGVRTPAGTETIPAATRGTPLWLELGVRAAFD